MNMEFTPPECGEDGECSQECVVFDWEHDSGVDCKLGMGDASTKMIVAWRNDVFPGPRCPQYATSLKRRNAALGKMAQSNLGVETTALPVTVELRKTW